jgi:hypothetical protein
MASAESGQILLDELAKGYEAIKPEMPRHLDRWGHAIGNGYTMKTWQKEYTAIKKYVGARPEYFLSYLDRALELTEK